MMRMLADPHNILNRWKNYLCQLLNGGGVNGVRQAEMHRVEPLIPEPFEVEISIERLKRYKSSGIDQILAELFQAECNTLSSEVHKLINSVWNKGELLQQWKKSITVRIYKKKMIKLTVVII
jgi:hypothetical protein